MSKKNKIGKGILLKNFKEVYDFNYVIPILKKWMHSKRLIDDSGVIMEMSDGATFDVYETMSNILIIKIK